MNASFILLVTLVVFDVESKRTSRQSRKIKTLEKKLKTCESAYEALNTKYVKAEEKWKFENFSGGSVSCNTEKPRKQRKITVKGMKSTALTWKALKQPKGKMKLTWKVDDASRSLQSVSP